MLAVVLFTYFGYPLLVTLVSTIWRRPVAAAEHTPPVSLITCAYNEEAVIEHKIRNSLALEYPPDRLEIIIASDGSSDRTAELVQKYAHRGVRLYDSQPRKGKSQVLNEVIAGSKGDVVVVTDANIDVHTDALKRLMRPFADDSVGGVWGNKIYRNPGGSAAGAGESLYLRYEKYLKTRETLLGSIVSGEGSLLAFRRQHFQPIRLEVNDDFALSTNVIAAGKRLLFEPSAINYEDTAPTNRDEFRRKIRIIEKAMFGFFSRLPLANPFRTGFYAISFVNRQLLRRLVAFLFLGMALLLPYLAVSRGGIYTWLLAGGTVVAVLALVGALVKGKWRGFPLFFVPYYFCLVNLAALIGMLRALVGYRSVTWQPTRRG